MNLNDKYTEERGTVYLNGIQALVRLPLDQVRRDRAAGLNTGVYISGYEGSPLGGYDLALARAGKLLSGHRIHFSPGMNEDLAATAVMGSQLIHVIGKTNCDGVVGIWYGKGPGVDRSGDALRHANLIGSAGYCGALVLAGDDHLCKSSTIPHQSDLSLYNFGIPTLFPGNTQEILDYGLQAIALSRFSGAWAGLKLVTNVCDGGGTLEVDPNRISIVTPEGYQKRTDPRLIPPVTLGLELEVNHRRLEAAREFAYQNKLNRCRGARDGAWLGIATAGKPYYDLAQALSDLGLDEEGLRAAGIRVGKFGMIYPLEPRFTREFAAGLETILVIEEKRSFLELQLRELLYNLPSRPIILGKQDENGAPLLPVTGELDPDILARVVAGALAHRGLPERVAARLKKLDAAVERPRELVPQRPPNFCSGCPHNRSTMLLEGQMAGGGIGCHGMAIMLADSNRGYSFSTQMGGEGAPWLGMAPFVERQHIFQNIGDGTYAHSGSLAIQACVAAGVNITYKILYNGHVAMTGGQDVVAALPIPDLTRKLESEGVRKIYLLTEDVTKYMDGAKLAGNAVLKDRQELPGVLAEVEKIPGVTVIIYDQQCAAEKRRWRSRGKLTEPVKRLVIHEEVCEGCGDCVKQSNCMSLQPVETELGQKMKIHQSSCNKDYTCALGDCPSFLTVTIKEGTGLKRRRLPKLPPAEVPPPRDVVEIGEAYRILLPGVGGTGVVTINALLATAGLLDGLSVITLDQTGLAQKGGAVVSHLALSRRPVEGSAKINFGNADLILGFDLLGAANAENLKTADPARTVAAINSGLTPTADSIRRRMALAGPERLLELIRQNTNHGRNIYVDATRLAESLFGSHLAVNIVLLGAAFQAGLIPISEASLQEAIRLNDVAVERNIEAFQWGRKYYLDAAGVEAIITPPAPRKPGRRFDRSDDLKAYQNADWARAYAAFVNKVEVRAPQLKETVEKYLFKLMMYKDEYEVARLLTKPAAEQNARGIWEAPQSIAYNIHPPLLRAFGLKRKLKLGPWFRWPLKALAAMKFLRGKPLDPFRYAAIRRQERALIGWYCDVVDEVMGRLTPETLPLALEIAALPDQIRGYEQIKAESIRRVMALAEEKLTALRAATVEVSS